MNAVAIFLSIDEMIEAVARVCKDKVEGHRCDNARPALIVVTLVVG